MGTIFSRSLWYSVPLSACSIFYILSKLYAYYRRYRIRKSISSLPVESQPKIVIIGAGFSGICTAIHLKTKLGFDNFVILERHNSVGGVWYTNVYPGCACDVPSYLYSYSFEQKYNWSKEYAPKKEILQYMKDTVNKYDINKHIKYDSNVKLMKYDENKCVWTVHYNDSNNNNNKNVCISCNILITCMGALTSTNIKYPYPDELLNKFKGKITHSGKWDINYSYSNKDIAVIGSGTSAIQIVPELHKECGNNNKLYIFQRSPTYIYPRMDYNISNKTHLLYYYFPIFMYLRRFLIYLMFDCILYRLLQKKNAKLHKRAIDGFKKHLNKSIKNGGIELIDKLTPKGFTPGCKRIGISNDWYPTLDAINTELIINTNESKTCIIDFYDNGIILKNGRKINVDCIVFATGYEITKMGETGMDIIGKNNKSLINDIWATNYGPYSYKGTVLNSFPNWFMILGPGGGQAGNSFLTSIEIASNYIIQCIEIIINNKYKSIEIKKEIEQIYNKKLDERMHEMIFTQNERSWYKITNKDGKFGRVFTLFPYSMATWWCWLRKPNINNFIIKK